MVKVLGSTRRSSKSTERARKRARRDLGDDSTTISRRTLRIPRDSASEPDDGDSDDKATSDEYEDVSDESNGVSQSKASPRRRAPSRSRSRAKARLSLGVSGSARRTTRAAQASLPRLTRRSSLPRRQSPASNPARNAGRTRKSAPTTSGLAVPQQPTKKQLRILSPLPVNHQVHQLRRGGSDRRASSPAKKTRDNGKRKQPVTFQLAIGRKRKSDLMATESEAESSEESEEEVEDVSEEQQGSDEAESDAMVVRRLRRRDQPDEEASASEEEQQEEASEEEDDDDAEMGSVSFDESQFNLFVADRKALLKLRREDLIALYLSASDSYTETSSLHLSKAELVQSILDARPDSPEQLESPADSDGSVRPFTSREGSPDQTRGKKRVSPAKKGTTKRRATRQHVPTPPHSSSDASNSSEEDSPEELVDEGASRSQRKRSLVLDASQSSHTTRSMQQAAEEQAKRHLRNGRVVVLPPPGRHRSISQIASDDDDEQEATEEEDNVSDDGNTIGMPTPPVATRTRNAVSGSPKAVTRAKLSPKAKGKAKAVNQDQSDDEDDDDDDASMGGEDSAEGEDGDDVVMDDARPKRGSKTGTTAVAATATRGRRNARAAHSKPLQVETPPSDADDESGPEEDDVASEDEAQVVVRQLRNGKVVPLVQPSVDDESELEEEEEEDFEVEEDNDEDVDLASATSKTLLRCKRDELVRLCQEHELDGVGTKKDLVNALLEWRDSNSGSGSDTTASNATAKAGTKTAALRAIESSPRSGNKTPLLMRGEHLSSPGKPHTPEHSKGDEQEEVNALDLESLQLQDKEIQPDKLIRLEKIGSGGFKDVFKGTYRKKTIAIADIRGHLTEMDIKELGLLRDLRHPNIVQFIGVSIPKDPAISVPVMIVTELCANGDLFDYIRGIDHPPFEKMLEIMLGISKGVEYLHTRHPPIIHRDIKSSNVLITAQGVAKLNDFGLAKVKTSTKSMIRSLVGTVNWQAPELWVANPRYNEKVDVYSVALVFWEILQWHQPVKRYPFESMNEHAIYDAVGHRNLRPSTASIGRTWGGEILQLVEACWNGDSAQRPSMREVVLHLEVMLTTEREKNKAEKKERSRR